MNGSFRFLDFLERSFWALQQQLSLLCLLPRQLAPFVLHVSQFLQNMKGFHCGSVPCTVLSIELVLVLCTTTPPAAGIKLFPCGDRRCGPYCWAGRNVRNAESKARTVSTLYSPCHPPPPPGVCSILAVPISLRAQTSRTVNIRAGGAMEAAEAAEGAAEGLAARSSWAICVPGAAAPGPPQTAVMLRCLTRSMVGCWSQGELLISKAAVAPPGSGLLQSCSVAPGAWGAGLTARHCPQPLLIWPK